jgi:hypothetical protein
MCAQDFCVMLYKSKLLPEVITGRSKSPRRLYLPNRPVGWSLPLMVLFNMYFIHCCVRFEIYLIYLSSDCVLQRNVLLLVQVVYLYTFTTVFTPAFFFLAVPLHAAQAVNAGVGSNLRAVAKDARLCLLTCADTAKGLLRKKRQ